MTHTVETPGGLRFDVTTWGPRDGTPLLALHGFPQCAASWADLAELLAPRGIRVIAFDQRGYSPGARPPLDTFTLPNFVSDALAVADACDLPTFDLIGFGMGAAQSWAVASAAPDRVRTVTALRFPHPAAFAEGVATDPEQKAAWAETNALSPPEKAVAALLGDDAHGLREFLRGSGLPSAATEATIARVGTPNVLIGALSWHEIPLSDMAAVGPVTVPSAFLWSHGPALTESTVNRCGKHVTGPYVQVELGDVAHWILETNPAVVVPHLVAHIRR
jgi:pimeloyl-ACP methyl ester carboxylesterase